MQTGMLKHQMVLSSTMEPAETILVCLLGNFRLLRHGRPLSLLVNGKAMTLLSELALHLDNGVPREELLETLWPEQDAVHSSVSLNSLVYSLQRLLRDDRQDAAALVYINGCYTLNKAAGVSSDIARFDAHVRHGTRLAADGHIPAAAQAFESALDLYRGDLCTCTTIYAVIERERLRASFLSVLAWLADRSYRNGDDEAALDHALRLLAYDPCREDAHRVVMRVRVRRGERTQALRQYRVCEDVLRREFDAAPDAPTRDLFDQIRSGSSLS